MAHPAGFTFVAPSCGALVTTLYPIPVNLLPVVVSLCYWCVVKYLVYMSINETKCYT